MLTTSLILFILFLLFSWAASWIRYFNKLDKRFDESIWRYSYDHHVVGERDISILDDREFVLLRRKRNSVITTMYFIVFLAFIFFMSLMGDILIKITG
jgi:hypothetical protein